jgi:hypothetical protein
MLNGSGGSLLTSRSSLAKMEDFLLCLNIDASQLRVLGDDITDKQVLKKMLHVVPNKLEQVAILMETLLNLDVLTIEEAVGHLHAVEQRKKLPSSKDSEGRLLLTKEEWMACMKTCDGSGSFAAAHGGGSSNDGGKNADKNKGQKQNTGGGQKSNAGHEDVCNYYGKRGHWAKECHKKKCNEAAQVHMAQGEEEEQSLLLAHCTAHNDPIGVNSAPAVIPSPSATPHCIIHIDEQKVFTDLGVVEGGDHDRWIIDTGATNHMTGSWEIFTDLDLQVYNMVKFSDGSVTQIEGRSNIILSYKNGGHCTLTGVYFIPHLKASIITLGQLDEMGCRIDINHGVLCIYDQYDLLLAKVQSDASRLYYLQLWVGHPVCLSVKCTEAASQWHDRYGHLNFGTLRRLATNKMV